MSKTAAQATQANSQGGTRSNASVLQRQSTLGPHVCVQREAAGPAVHPAAPSLVRQVIDSPGRPLDAATRSGIEPRFGFDFSNVRVHSDDRAAESARAVNANAYTAGNHVAFGAGKYAPGTSGGQRLLAHELTHVVQQARGPVSGTPIAPGMFVSHPADPFERDAAATVKDRTSLPPEGMAVEPLDRPAAGDVYLQRDDASSIIGAIAGVAGLGLGIAALVYAIKQTNVAKHPPASASPTGGLTINNAPFNTLAQPAPGTDAATAKDAKTHSQPLLYVDAPHTQGQANNFGIGLQTKTDGHNIIDGFTQEEHVTGYTGGGDGATAQITFTGTPVPILAAPAPAPEAKPAPATMGTANPSGVDAISGAAPAASTDASATKSEAAPAAKQPEPAPAAPPAEVLLRFQGINSAKGEIQRFKGAYRVSGNGDVRTEKSECMVTQGDPQSMEVADHGYISVGLGRTPSPQPNAPVPVPSTPQAAPPATPAAGGGVTH